MLNEPSCEICAHDNWTVIGQRTYTQFEGEGKAAYTQKRFKVLFDKWFPGKGSVTLTSVLCKHCGFIIYTPRPEEHDIDSKYKYLEELGQDYGQITPPDSIVEIKRSNSVVRYLKDNLDLQHVHRILDYGGGDGRLMSGFSGLGKQCFLVDYNKNCVPGVTKLSDTIGSLGASEKFDLIVCSHVIEHVAQPVRVLQRLMSHLNKDGLVFIEVPLEIWRTPPLQSEPVTHINFFTPNSLYNLMIMAGLMVTTCEIAACPYQNGTEGHGIRAIGRARTSPSTPPASMKLRKPDAMNLLKPNILRIFRYHMYLPGRIPGVLLRKLTRGLK